MLEGKHALLKSISQRFYMAPKETKLLTVIELLWLSNAA